MSFSEPCALAVDFGGTSIKMGVTAGDRILATADRIPTAMFESPQAIIDAMIAAARTLRGQFPTACVMGMGMPGWCDYQQGVLYQLTNVRVWDRQIPVKEMMEQALGLPVVLDGLCGMEAGRRARHVQPGVPDDGNGDRRGNRGA